MDLPEIDSELSPEDLGETELMDMGQPQADAGETELMDMGETRMVDRAPAYPETTVIPQGDGIDVLDDPYAATIPDLDYTKVAPVISSAGPEVGRVADSGRTNRVWPMVLGIVVALALVAGGAYMTWKMELWGGKSIPNVVGMEQALATQALERDGFAVEVVERPGDDSIGKVITVSPAAGTRIDPAGGVTITVAVARTIPDVVGQTSRDAERALYEAGASNVTITYVPSSAAEDTVVSVDPGVGQPFVTTDAITLTVAQSYTVPDVTGRQVFDAKKALEAAGFQVTVEYVDEDGEKDTVLETVPAAGEKIDEGGSVTLKVASPMPTSVTDLPAYFGANPGLLAKYVTDQGFELVTAHQENSGNAFAVYRDSSGALLRIGDEPEAGTYDILDTTYDALEAGCAVGGVRYRFSGAPGAGALTRSGLQSVMDLCGLQNLGEAVTEEDMAEVEGVKGTDLHFICGSGVQGNYVWTVLIGGHGGTQKTIATIAPKSHYDSIDLSAYDGSVARYMVTVSLIAGK